MATYSIADLQRVAAQVLGEVHFVIEAQRILELGIGGLAAQLREAGERLRRESAGRVRDRGQAGDAVQRRACWRRRCTGGVLPALVRLTPMRPSRIECRTDGPGVGRGGLLVERADEAVAASARRPADARLVVVVQLALADAQEAAHPVVDLAIHLGVELVGVGAVQGEQLEVVGADVRRAL